MVYLWFRGNLQSLKIISFHCKRFVVPDTWLGVLLCEDDGYDKHSKIVQFIKYTLLNGSIAAIA